jgi:hypothetical protein
MDFSTYLRDAILSWIKGTAFPSPPANLYIAFYSGDPGRTGTGGTDITTSVRAAGRIAIASSGWSAITAVGNSRVISNSSGLTIGSAASTISSTHIGIWDASSGGNFIAKAVAPYSFISGTSYSIAIGDLDFIFD